MTGKKKVNFVVTDLDDTIWDWLSMWHNSFLPYLDRIRDEFGIDERVLKEGFKRLHQKYGSTEYSYVYNEIDALTLEQKARINVPNNGDRSILHEYYSNKKHNLFLFDGVLNTLKHIKSKGALIVGFTESNAFFTKYRIKHLSLDGLINYIYAPIDSGVPPTVNRHYSEDFWEPEITQFRYLSKRVKKPDSEILEIILRDFRAVKENSVYIGDKLDRDVFMAQQASIDSVYAEYGHQINTAQYELLREVTHWTLEDVEREKHFKESFHTKPQPTYILKKSFSELNDYLDFFEFYKR